MGTINSRYVKVVINESTGCVEVYLVIEVFKRREYLNDQVQWAKECHFTRHALREQFHIDDAELDRRLEKDPEIAMKYFTDHHGDEWFGKKLRASYYETIAIKLKHIRPDCFLVTRSHGCNNCNDCAVINGKPGPTEIKKAV